MSTTVSYVWVNNSAKENEPNEIPSFEEGHGLRNIIANANKTPNAKHVLYVDRLTNGETTFDANIKLPSNVEFKTVDSLFEECEALVKENKEGFVKYIAEYNKTLGEAYIPEIDDLDGEKLIANMREIYNAEMQYGKPAFAGNAVKLLSVYKGEIMCDIGVGLKSKKIINDLNNNLLRNTVTSFVGLDKLNSASTLQFLHVPKINTNYLLQEINAFCERYTTMIHNDKSKKMSVQEFVQNTPKCGEKNELWMQDLAYANTIANLAYNTKGLQALRYTREDIIWNHKLSWKEGLGGKSSDPLLSQEIALLPKQDISKVPSLKENEIENSFLNININSFPKQAPTEFTSNLFASALKEQTTAFIKCERSSIANKNTEIYTSEENNKKSISRLSSSATETTQQENNSAPITEKTRDGIFTRF